MKVSGWMAVAAVAIVVGAAATMFAMRPPQVQGRGEAVAASPAQPNPASAFDREYQDAKDRFGGGQYELALGALARADRAKPGDFRVWYRVAECCVALNHRAAAEEAIKKTLALKPELTSDADLQALSARSKALPVAAAPSAGIGSATELSLDALLRICENQKPGDSPAIARPALPAGTGAVAKIDVAAQVESRKAGLSEPDQKMLDSLKALLAASRDAKPITPLESREFDALSDGAAKADPITEPGRKAVIDFFEKTRPLMGAHPEAFRFAATRAHLALRNERFQDAWEAGRILLLAKADEQDEKQAGQAAVLDVMIAIKAAGLDDWSWSKAKTAAEGSSGLLQGPRAGHAWTNSVGMTFVYIPKGSFVMGSPSDEGERDSDEIQHQVLISKPFALGSTEVTQGQWTSVMKTALTDEASKVGRSDLHPMYSVNWNEAKEFCQKLTAQERANGKIDASQSYRLPTESEWEYACRAGSSGPYAGTGDLDDMGWSYTNAAGSTHPVRLKKSNAWGLYDMHGNVWEWCSDAYGPYPSGTSTDPRGSGAGAVRVLRGGSWNLIPGYCRAARRHWLAPGHRFSNIGFRVALDLK